MPDQPTPKDWQWFWGMIKITDTCWEWCGSLYTLIPKAE